MLYMTCMQDQSYYYLSHDKKPMGPLSRPQLEAKLSMGEIEPTTLVAAVGGTDWVTLADLLGIENKQDPPPSSSMSSSSTSLSCPHCEKEQDTAFNAALLQCTECSKVVAPDPTSSLWAHFMSSMRRYVCFKGRATRKEYWSFVLFYLIFSIPAGLGLAISLLVKVVPMALKIQENNTPEAMQALEAKLAEMTSMEGMMQAGGSVQLFFILTVVVSYLFMLPYLGLTIRRFHDVGISGYVPVLATILGLVTQFLSVFFAFEADDMPLLSVFSTLLTVIILVFAFMDSKKGSNKYGPSSKYPHS